MVEIKLHIIDEQPTSLVSLFQFPLFMRQIPLRKDEISLSSSDNSTTIRSTKEHSA